MPVELNENIVEANIAIVLTDIIGSTRFVQVNGKYAAAKWFSAHDKIVMSLITRFDGQWLDNSDGTLMYFGNVVNAIEFAFEYKKYLRKKKFPFRSRIGIHWDSMLIVKTEQSLISGGAKRLAIEGIGKNIAARTMSLCGEEQILLSESAYKKYKMSGHRSNYIPKKALSVLVGLYSFKGVSEPEAIYAIGMIEAQLQPPPDSEKAKRLGGAKKIKTRLRQKQLEEIFWWVTYRLAFLSFIFLSYLFYPILSSPSGKMSIGIDWFIFMPYEWIEPICNAIVKLFKLIKANI